MSDFKMTKKLKKWLSLAILLIGLPIYIILAITILNLFDRPNIIIELVVYAVLGILWAIPFKFVFKGVGKN